MPPAVHVPRERRYAGQESDRAAAPALTTSPGMPAVA